MSVTTHVTSVYTPAWSVTAPRRVESACRASGSDDLRRWDKDPGNPLIAGPPPSLGSGYHRDPFLWQDQQGWQLIVGSGTAGPDRHGKVVRYRSGDARTWQYQGVLFEAPRHLDGLDLGHTGSAPSCSGSTTAGC